MHKTSIRQKFFLLIFSLFLAVIILELGLRLGGFVLLSLQEYRNRISLREKGTYRILCLGESTTEAGGVDSYPSQLQEILNERKIGEKFSVINKGLSGITTEGIVSQLKGNLDKYNPDMVIVMMGINDGPETRKHDEEKEKRPVFSFTSFRVYKLARLLRLHFIQKLKELGYAGISEGNFANQKNNYSLPAIREINKKESNMPAGGNADDFWAKINSGKRYREVQGEYNKAIEKFKEAIEIDPDNDIGYSELGNCYILTGELDKCEEALKRHWRKVPKREKSTIFWVFATLTRKNTIRLKRRSGKP